MTDLTLSACYAKNRSRIGHAVIHLAMPDADRALCGVRRGDGVADPGRASCGTCAEAVKAQEVASVAAYYQANVDRIRDARRDQRHGLRPGQWEQIRAAQQNRCYLCGDELPENRREIATDHDHRCCPPRKSCDACRRGLACQRCNTIIGWADDDPSRLRRIADRLEAAQSTVGHA